MIGVDNKISLDSFTDGLNLLGSVYGCSHAVFTNEAIKSIWFKYFSNYTREKWIRVIEYYIAHSQWFPKSPHEIQKLWDESGEQERLAQQKLAALPPTQEEEFTPEQLIENQRKINLAMKLALAKGVKIPPLNQVSSHELEAIVEGAKKAQSAKQSTALLQKNGQLIPNEYTLFSDMKKYFHSGSEKYRQMAIDWASDPVNGCEFVYQNGEIADIKEVEF